MLVKWKNTKFFSVSHISLHLWLVWLGLLLFVAESIFTKST